MTASSRSLLPALAAATLLLVGATLGIAGPMAYVVTGVNGTDLAMLDLGTGNTTSIGSFTDSDGRPPRHTFFYPIEEYDPDHLDQLATLARAGFGEVEIHLHHDGDTPESLHRTLAQAVENLAGRHGLLGRHRETGRPGYAFVHGNWALNNARPDGCWCGVNRITYGDKRNR